MRWTKPLIFCGGLDGVVASAGVIKLLTSENTNTDDWLRIIDINLNANFHLAKAAAPHLRQHSLAGAGGSMVFVSSQIGLVGHHRAAAYAASKSAINGLTRSLALELASDNVRSNAVAPGPIATDMTAENQSRCTALPCIIVKHSPWPFMVSPTK